MKHYITLIDIKGKMGANELLHYGTIPKGTLFEEQNGFYIRLNTNKNEVCAFSKNYVENNPNVFAEYYLSDYKV